MKPEMLDKLMSTSIITDQPSIYLPEMLSIATRLEISNNIMLHKFLQGLLISIGRLLVTHKDLNLTRLGQLADELMHLIQGIAKIRKCNYIQTKEVPIKTSAIQFDLKPFQKG